MRLADLPPLLRDEPALTRALGEPDARLAVVEVARPIAIAALASLSRPPPAGRRLPDRRRWPPSSADDLAQFLPAGQVAVFPAWETLPFERVSPSVETMGQRLELLWRLRDPDRCPAVIVTGVRGAAAAARARTPRRSSRSPSTPATSSTPTSSSPGSSRSATAARSSSSTAASSPAAGAIIDVFPSTGDAPIRIDLWGDEVDRLTRSASTTSARSTTSPRR